MAFKGREATLTTVTGGNAGSVGAGQVSIQIYWWEKWRSSCLIALIFMREFEAMSSALSGEESQRVELEFWGMEEMYEVVALEMERKNMLADYGKIFR